MNSTANPLYDTLNKNDSVFHEYVNIAIHSATQNPNEVIYDNLINGADEHIYDDTAGINQVDTNDESIDAGEDENEPAVEVQVERHRDESSTDCKS